MDLLSVPAAAARLIAAAPARLALDLLDAATAPASTPKPVPARVTVIQGAHVSDERCPTCGFDSPIAASPAGVRRIVC